MLTTELLRDGQIDRALAAARGKVRGRHVAVQIDPDMQTMKDVEGAKLYLAEYFGKEANIDIYWGSAEEFLAALRDELAAAGDLTTDAKPEQDDEDEWNF